MSQRYIYRSMNTWDEKNYIEQKTNCLNNSDNAPSGSTNEIRSGSTMNAWPATGSLNQMKQYSKHISFTKEYLREMFDYNPSTGDVVWKVKTSIRNKIGEKVGTLNKSGYYIVTINYKRYRLHRLIWVYIHGGVPNTMDIDHVNGVGSDNRLENLRIATRSQNNSNIGRRKSATTSKYKGVCFDKSRNKWTAQMDNLGKHHNLGRFDNEEDAYSAYCEAAKKMHKNFFHA